MSRFTRKEKKMQKANLVLHCGATSISREKLEKIKAPKPTETWNPIPHSRMLSLVEDAVEKAGLHVVEEAHGIMADGERYFGLLQLANGKNPDDYGLVVGLRNSTNKSLRAGLAVGSQVFVCDNLAFSADIVIGRKHTSKIDVDLPGLVIDAVAKLGGMRSRQDARIGAYKATEISDVQAHDLIVRGFDEGVYTATRIPAILKEWRAPRHPEFAAAKNGWRLFNAVTEIAKDAPFFDRPMQTIALHKLMDGACGVVAN
jgi:uncharacterized protein DUF932